MDQTHIPQPPDQTPPTAHPAPETGGQFAYPSQPYVSQSTPAYPPPQPAAYGVYDWTATAGQAPPTVPPPPVRPAAKGSFYSRRPLASMAVVAATAAIIAGAVGGVAGATVAGGDGSLPTAVVGSLTTSDSGVAPASLTEGTVESAAAIIGPSVVTIAVTGQESSGGFGQQSQRVSGTGSGVVIRSDGYILTNNHVVSAATSSGTVSVEFSDGSSAPARIVGTDPISDLAVVKVDKSGLKAATFADSSALNVGQTVIAVGAPLGLSNTVTEGIVSTLHRPVTTGESNNSNQAVIDAIQTDAAINPGNSGGALVDLAGRVVGINSAIATVGSSSSGQAGNIGVGFAIPANDAVRVANELIDNGKATHAQLGVGVGSAADSSASGATLSSVTAGGAAANAGLERGDVVTKIDNRTITGAESLIATVRSYAPGSTLTVTYTRDGQTNTAKVTLDSAS
ncbi:MAG: trypsin-like peptidase domain-containing protein [Actinomycetes bacterium]